MGGLQKQSFCDTFSYRLYFTVLDSERVHNNRAYWVHESNVHIYNAFEQLIQK